MRTHSPGLTSPSKGIPAKDFPTIVNVFSPEVGKSAELNAYPSIAEFAYGGTLIVEIISFANTRFSPSRRATTSVSCVFLTASVMRLIASFTLSQGVCGLSQVEVTGIDLFMGKLG